jgi:hypothetical protein
MEWIACWKTDDNNIACSAGFNSAQDAHRMAIRTKHPVELFGTYRWTAAIPWWRKHLAVRAMQRYFPQPSVSLDVPLYAGPKK